MPVTPEDRQRYNRAWKEKNPEAARESHRKAQLKWREANREKVRERQNKWTRENRDKVNGYRREAHNRNKYGMSIAEREAMLIMQDGKCAICEATEPGNRGGWVVDHCHESGNVRGMLCHHCNLALGNVKDNTAILRKMISYLEGNR